MSVADDAHPDRVGERFEVVVGPVAHGGHFVARHDGQVVFVRHAISGERVVVEITEDSGRFLRADAVEVREPSPFRVTAPCPLARPDGCGGCDFQHVALEEQRRLKAAVVREQLQRLAGLDWDVVVEEVPNPLAEPGTPPGLRWRTRMQYAELPGGRRGLRKHRSHEIVEVEDCLIDAGTTRASSHREYVGDRAFDVAGDGFWQVHPGAGSVLVDTVLDQVRARPGESVLDLYAGAGLFAGFLAEAVGGSGSVTAVESDTRACAHAKQNLAAYPWVEVVQGRVDRVLARRAQAAATTTVPRTADVVVLDPPRAGARKAVVDAIAALGPRAVSYVACDPAALARDVAYFADHGYQLQQLRAFDLFPMTHHVECVALLAQHGADLR